MIIILEISRLLKIVPINVDAISRGGTPLCTDVSEPGRLALKEEVEAVIYKGTVSLDCATVFEAMVNASRSFSELLGPISIIFASQKSYARALFKNIMKWVCLQSIK